MLKTVDETYWQIMKVVIAGEEAVICYLKEKMTFICIPLNLYRTQICMWQRDNERKYSVLVERIREHEM
jgi:hypothetical protein